MKTLSVAVVDDEAPVRVALRRLLRLAEYTVTTFESGEEFLASLASQQPDCVLLDVHMPGITGLIVHARMRAANIDIPVVFITASDTLDIEQSVKAAGAITAAQTLFERRVARRRCQHNQGVDE